MYHPTTRLLTILELLQTHPRMGGDELARRLEVEPRTVRRYIQMLQDMGMPIEGSRGPGGGYRLRPGFKLPPLLFTEDEATAIVFALLGAPWLEIDFSSVAVEGALAKVYRVLPLRGRERLQSISEHLVLVSHQEDMRPDASLLIALSDAIQERRRVAIVYRSHHNQQTTREIEPYGLAGRKGQWYVVGYCCLRKDFRLFRLDRMDDVRLLKTTFTRDEDFDCQEFVVKRLDTIPALWQIEIEFHAELYTVRHKIPTSHGKLSETSSGVLFQTHHSHLPEMARYLMSLNIPFVIRQPPELRDALRELALHMSSIADTVPEIDISPGKA
ncbi:helix-turn-helix transcriptional regulator [Ktedonospora formicarum]|uniref:Transcriptional regulator n=1 Tax=Ktedonospora formicarum TaxID=2778364 RepID=A0A8J3I6P7_9CHLR|nr:YafY family protein [Ktedonospora formicarum]GHO46863.1 transcriptional regulator [Ktedonospora formicarum]